MRIFETIEEMHAACVEVRKSGSLGLVPTMGALHEGHLSLVRAARRECNAVAVSIFVNPTQFAPGEDFERYPRQFEKDCEMLEREGVELLFAPSAEEMYRPGATAFVDAGELGERLDGQFRPGHFRGVATVVAKLFHIVEPDRAFFGQKDAAQVAVLRAMVRDLNFPLRLVVCPTVREQDGLAMSSRNRHLSADEREQALALWRSLMTVQALAYAGMCSAAELQGAMVKLLEVAEGVRLEYAEIVDPDTLQPVANICQGALVAVAAHVGKTRLIDNVVLAPVTGRRT